MSAPPLKIILFSAHLVCVIKLLICSKLVACQEAANRPTPFSSSSFALKHVFKLGTEKWVNQYKYG